MIQYSEHIERIETKLNILLGKFRNLKRDNEGLRKELVSKNNICEELRKKIEEYEIRISLHIRSQAGVESKSKVELERKINDYIKEIDRCIALLGDQD